MTSSDTSAHTAVLPPRTHSLNDVRDIIPASCYQRSTGRAVLALVQAWVLYAIPMVGLALTNTWWALLVWWALAGLAVSGLFVLGHDASHGALLDSRKANRVVAQVCMVPSFHVEAAWDLGHNRIHHGYTTRQGFDFVWHPATVQEYAAMGRFARLRHRVEWSRLGSGAYFLRTVWWQKMWRFNAPGKRHDAIVRDKLVLSAVLLLAFGGAATFGAHRWSVRCVLGAVQDARRAVPAVRAGDRVDGVRAPRRPRHPLVAAQGVVAVQGADGEHRC